jgi:hypothetical protein
MVVGYLVCGPLILPCTVEHLTNKALIRDSRSGSRSLNGIE